MQMRQRDVAALDAKYTKELADAKAENDALRDDVAAGRRQLHVNSLSVSAWSHHRLRRGCHPSTTDWQTPLNGIISPSEGWSLCKNNWKEPKYIVSGADRVAHIDGPNSCNYCEQYTRFPARSINA